MLYYVNLYVDSSQARLGTLPRSWAKQRFEKGFNMSRKSNINLKNADANRDRAFLPKAPGAGGLLLCQGRYTAGGRKGEAKI